MSDSGETVLWLVETWAERLAETIENMTAERPSVVTHSGVPGWDATEPALWWEQPLSLGSQAVVWVGAPERVWLYIGTYVLRSAGIETSEPADARNTYLEVLSQALSGMSRNLSERLHRQADCENGKETEAPAPDSTSFQVELNLGDAPVEPISFRLAATFARTLNFNAPVVGPAEPAPQVPTAAGPIAGHDMAPVHKPQAFDLLMEVELPVSVSFGRAALPLKDVLKLITGSIVELNRPISDPVEVIVNNCVIARGEVVVVEGNYGVRIKEIISREKRLRTLT
jgi:flagellar motor switch protein FliN/FliY